MHKASDKKKGLKIIKELYKDKNSLSVTLTGSYSEHFDINKAGDIDIILICKKLDKVYFQKCQNKIRKLKNKFFGYKQNLIINSTFGPIKFYKKNSIVFHLMIYDLESHIEHTIKSPFTCYDWERSNVYIGKSLKELSPVFQLQLRDFYEARRSSQEYLDDILKNRISYREYEFKNKKYILKKKYFLIDEVNKRDFIYHTIKFLLINYVKFEKNLNTLINDKTIDKKFYEIVRDKTCLNDFKKLRILKNKKSQKNIENSKQLVVNFIKIFGKHIKDRINSNKSIIFTRHKKTNLNTGIFLGQKNNPKIIDKKIPLEFHHVKIEKCFSSPSKRCIQTAELVCKKSNININNNLKEIDYGEAENLSFNQFKKNYPHIVNMWNRGKDPKFPSGESTFDVIKRLKRFLKNGLKIKHNKSNKSTLILTHNVVIRCLIGSKFHIKMNDWFKINIEYFDLLEFRLEENKLRPNINRIKFLDIFRKLYLK
jgi:ribonuclease H / adenosylcobalamin/alpha-ribazole phosphatase